VESQFWIKQLNVGQLHASIVKNIPVSKGRPFVSIRVDRLYGLFITVHVWRYYLNIDWC
jgi:hypothetical protein